MFPLSVTPDRSGAQPCASASEARLARSLARSAKEYERAHGNRRERILPAAPAARNYGSGLVLGPRRKNASQRRGRSVVLAGNSTFRAGDGIAVSKTELHRPELIISTAGRSIGWSLGAPLVLLVHRMVPCERSSSGRKGETTGTEARGSARSLARVTTILSSTNGAPASQVS